MESVAHTRQTQAEVYETQGGKNTTKHIHETEPQAYKALVQQWSETKMKQSGATIGLVVSWKIVHVHLGVDYVFRNAKIVFANVKMKIGACHKLWLKDAPLSDK